MASITVEADREITFYFVDPNLAQAQHKTIPAGKPVDLDLELVAKLRAMKGPGQGEVSPIERYFAEGMIKPVRAERAIDVLDGLVRTAAELAPKAPLQAFAETMAQTGSAERAEEAAALAKAGIDPQAPPPPRARQRG